MRPTPVIPQGVRAVYFDAVGTLIHPDPPAAAAYERAGERFGSPVEVLEVARRFAAAFRRQEEIDRLAGMVSSPKRERQRWEQIVADVLPNVTDHRACFEHLWEHFGQPTAWRCAAETGPTLEALAARGYQLGIASNFDHRLRGVVAGLPELRRVGTLVISSEIGWKKPAPEFFQRLCEEAGLPPAAVLLVGDDLENDHAGARAFGMRSLLLDPCGRAPLSPLERIVRLGDLAGLPCGRGGGRDVRPPGG
jgi:putative hydrolase of the HAD superfamily